MNRGEIRLSVTNILQVPLNSFANDFTFIVNGINYETNHIMTDLLSPKISRIHLNDPTFDVYTINTRSRGDFSHILNLANFQNKQIENDELDFFNEIIEILGADSFELNMREDLEEITLNAVIANLKIHEQYSFIYKSIQSKEIDFISSNLFNLLESKESEMSELSLHTIERIINNPKLRINDEDQLITFINHLCELKSEFYCLYEYVHFCNLSNEKIREFTEFYDPKYLNYKVWNQISQRLQLVIENINISPKKQ